MPSSASFRPSVGLVLRKSPITDRWKEAQLFSFRSLLHPHTVASRTPKLQPLWARFNYSRIDVPFERERREVRRPADGCPRARVGWVYLLQMVLRYEVDESPEGEMSQRRS